MRLIPVTLNAAATPIIAKGVQPANSLPFQWLMIQNNAANNCRVGDSSVSATKGILLLASGGSMTAAPALEYTSDLYEWFIFGTAGQIIDVMLLD